MLCCSVTLVFQLFLTHPMHLDSGINSSGQQGKSMFFHALPAQCMGSATQTLRKNLIFKWYLRKIKTLPKWESCTIWDYEKTIIPPGTGRFPGSKLNGNHVCLRDSCWDHKQTKPHLPSFPAKLRRLFLCSTFPGSVQSLSKHFSDGP